MLSIYVHVIAQTVRILVYKELDRILEVCEGRKVFILAPLPRYILKTCCGNRNHCANVSKHDSAAARVSRKLLLDLDELNSKLADRYNSKTVEVLITGDLLSGQQNTSSGDLMEAQVAGGWAEDSVHGDKVAYTKIAMGVLAAIGANMKRESGLRDSSEKRKRSRDSDSEQGGSSARPVERDGSYQRFQSSNRKFPQPRQDNFPAYSTYPGDQRRNSLSNRSSGSGSGQFRR